MNANTLLKNNTNSEKGNYYETASKTLKKASNRKEFKKAHKKTIYQQNVWEKFQLKIAYMHMKQIIKKHGLS